MSLAHLLLQSQIKVRTKDRKREKKNPPKASCLHFDLSVSLCPRGYRVSVDAGDEGGTSHSGLVQWKDTQRVLRLIKIKNPRVTADLFLPSLASIKKWFWRNSPR